MPRTVRVKAKAQPQPPSLGLRVGSDYKRWTLDCVVTIAYSVALDFSDRPELYQQVADDVAQRLTDLQSSYGFQANFPDQGIRQRLMHPVFGESDGHGSGNDGSAFQTYRLPVLAAAADFAENTQPTSFPMLRERVRSALVTIKTHLVGLQGASLSQTESRSTSIFNIAQSILRDPNVSTVFGITGNLDPNWPLQSNDPQGAKLIENITVQRSDLPYGVISREMFVHMQRIAEKGLQSIRIMLDADTEDQGFDIDPLIAELYAWGSELGVVGGARPQQRSTRAQPPAAAATNASSAMRPQGASASATMTRPTLVRPVTVYSR